jgi:hypothetical protein
VYIRTILSRNVPPATLVISPAQTASPSREGRAGAMLPTRSAMVFASMLPVAQAPPRRRDARIIRGKRGCLATSDSRPVEPPVPTARPSALMSVSTPRPISRVVRWSSIRPRDMPYPDCHAGGGCNIPLHKNSPRGQDCSSIPGVADVSCLNGACRIYECMPGYTISFDQSTCHSEDQLRIIEELIKNPYKMAVDLL